MRRLPDADRVGLSCNGARGAAGRPGLARTGDYIADSVLPVVEAGLAACVSRVGPINSTYRWQGAIQDEPEVLLVIKTVIPRYSELEMRLKSLHPYEVPEIIALPIVAGSRSYLKWIEEETTSKQ